MVQALAGLQRQQGIGSLVRESGYGHRHFTALFREAVGVAHKAYARVLRFQHALRLVATRGNVTLAVIACEAGYSDPAHLSRAFMEMAGVTPSACRGLATPLCCHLAMPAQRA